VRSTMYFFLGMLPPMAAQVIELETA